MANTLKKKTTSGMGWSLADNFANQGILFLVGIILARILSPKDYGIIGIITIFLMLFNSLIDSGFSTALIRKVNADNRDYNTVFIFNLTFSLVLYILLYFIAPSISLFFKQPEVTPLLRVMGIILIINAFAIIQRTILIKKIDFKTQTKISVISSIISGGIGITMAYGNKGVWSLAGQQISINLITTLLLWYYSRAWKPAFEFSVQRFKEFFTFGWKIMIDGIIVSLWNDIYKIIIGKYYSTETLGQFTRANQFRNMTSRNFTAIIQRVSYPTLCSIQDDDIKLKIVFRKIVKTSSLFTFITMLVMSAVAHALIVTLIGEKWLPAVAFLQIITFSGLWKTLQALNKNMLKVKGFTGLLLKIELLTKVIALVPILLGIFISIYWMLWGSVVANLITYIIFAYYAGRLINYPLKEQLLDTLPILAISFFVGSIVWVFSFLAFHSLIVLLIQVSVAAIITILTCELLKREEYFELKSIVISFFRKIKILK
jgi:O-antigen/teichoic acid export membrane protein